MSNILKSEINTGDEVTTQTSRDAFMSLINDMVGYEIGRTTTIKDTKEAHEVVSDTIHALVEKRDMPGPDSEGFIDTLDAVREHYGVFEAQEAEIVM